MPAEWNLCEKDANVSIKYKNGIGSHENDWSYQNLSDSPDFDAISFAGLTPIYPYMITEFFCGRRTAP